jgi:glycosyltransferase involved in cell wall biosynthesis
MPQFANYLTKHWRGKPPDVVHAFSWTGGLAALGAVRGTDVPVVQTFHSLGLTERRHGRSTEVSASRVQMEACIGRNAAAVLVNSGDDAAELARLSVPKSAIRIVPCGVDTEVFRPEGQTAERGSRPRLVTFARPGQAKALEAVIVAVAQIPAAELVVVGGPDGKHLPRTGAFRDLAQLATRLHVRNRIVFAGELSQVDLAALLRSADLLVSASPYEPSGATTIQAMACGAPAIVSAVGGHLDAVIDGITGLLVAPEHPAMLAQRVRRLLDAPALRQAFGIAAVDRARSRYSWDRIGKETAAAYERCLDRTSEVSASLDDEIAELELDSEMEVATGKVAAYA